MDGVGRAFRVHVGPEAGYLESDVADFQEFQDALGRVMDAGDQAAEFVQMVQVLFRLPATAPPRSICSAFIGGPSSSGMQPMKGP